MDFSTEHKTQTVLHCVKNHISSGDMSVHLQHPTRLFAQCWWSLGLYINRAKYSSRALSSMSLDRLCSYSAASSSSGGTSDASNRRFASSGDPSVLSAKLPGESLFSTQREAGGQNSTALSWLQKNQSRGDQKALYYNQRVQICLDNYGFHLRIILMGPQSADHIMNYDPLISLKYYIYIYICILAKCKHFNRSFLRQS